MSAGASSFGMSGVNAHGLFASPKTVICQVSSLNWKRGRHWMSPPVYCLLVEADQRQAAQCRCCTSCLLCAAFCCPISGHRNLIAGPLMHSASLYIPVGLAFVRYAQKMQACLIRRLGIWTCRFLVQLSQPVVSYLMDHIVAGRSLLPGAAMFEATTAAGCTLAGRSGVDLCLADISIPSPVVMQSGMSQELACIVDINQGSLALQGNARSAPGEASCII